MDEKTLVVVEEHIFGGHWLAPRIDRVMSNTPNDHTFIAPFDPEFAFNPGKLEQIGALGTGAVKAVLSVHGITKVSISAYQLLVHNSPAYEWEELQPAVMDALKEALGLGDIEVVNKD